MFRDLLGYTTAKQNPADFRFEKEQFVQADGTYADAGFGRFAAGDPRFVLVLEGKGPKDPLDRPYGGRKRSAYEQALLYAVNQKLDWFLVTSLTETRLHYKGADQNTYERFPLAGLAEDDAAFARFVYLLGAERVIGPAGNHLDRLLAESRKAGTAITNAYYAEYRTLRELTFKSLPADNPLEPPARLLAATQKLLDRVLFVCFCEDRDMLPAGIVERTYLHKDPFRPRPVWENFKDLFGAVDAGSDPLNVARYNGGLFATDPYLNGLAVSNAACLGFRKLAEYEYGTNPTPPAKRIDVEILGHVFEQSIRDLEEMQNVLAGRVKEYQHRETKRDSRKEAGAFYTPEFITRYIVAQTVRPVLAERFERLRAARQAGLPKRNTGRKSLDDPAAFDPAALNESQRDALAGFWVAWLAELETVKVLDPACGSGAFLIEAFDQLYAEYERAEAFLKALGRPSGLFEPKRSILTSNLYGVDLNGEAVEIARLSCWVKTAELGKELTSLDRTIVRGNSVVTDPAVHPQAFDWQEAFPEVFAAGGFDAVVGNPPYVRQEWLKDYKEHWRRFKSFEASADLFVYFFELGLGLLRPGGRVGYITSGGWVRGGYGGGLRALLAGKSRLESLIDFGEYQPFAGAEMIRPTVAVLSKNPPGEPVRLWKWLTAGKPPENLSDIIQSADLMTTAHLGRAASELDPDDVRALRVKLSAGGTPLGKYCGGNICYGIKTGANEAFVIDAATRRAILDVDPKSADLIKPFVQGTNLRPWHVEESGEFLIFPRRGIRIEDYPGVLTHLQQFRAGLEPKPNDWPAGKAWPGRKAGGYKWYEIQDTVDYWQAFEHPKIVWPDITNRPRFSMDLGQNYLGNTGYVIPGGDYYLLGVLASWATWFVVSKTAQPLRLRSDRWQYRLIAQFMEQVPVPDAPPADRTAIAGLAETCNGLGAERYALHEQVRRRLTQAFRAADGKLNEKATDWWEQPLPGLGDALKASFKLKKNPLTSPAVADEWEPYLRQKAADQQALADRIAAAEAEITDRVFRLLALTPAEQALLRREVEH